MFAGHFEQPGRVSGTLVVGDRTYAVDCHTIRDRSWGPRQMPERLRLGNAYATAADFAFFAYVNPAPDRPAEDAGEDGEPITHGYLFEDGVEAAASDVIAEVSEYESVEDGGGGVAAHDLADPRTNGCVAVEPHQSHFLTRTRVPAPGAESISNSSMRRRTPGRPRPRVPPEL